MFTGGEPLLREDLFLLASYARGFAKTVLATNGLAVTPENKYDILECFDDIRISLDGTRRRHDAYRGAGTYDKALQSAILLGEQCAVTITYTKQDEGHIGGLLERLTNTPIRRIYSTCVRKLGRATDRMIPSPERIRMEEDRFFGRETSEHVPSNACGAGHCAGKYEHPSQWRSVSLPCFMQSRILYGKYSGDGTVSYPPFAGDQAFTANSRNIQSAKSRSLHWGTDQRTSDLGGLPF